jgi:hypothetical protein
MSKKVRNLAAGLLILVFPILASGCESCSNNRNDLDEHVGNDRSTSSANNNSGNGGNANNKNGNSGKSDNNGGNGGNTGNDNGNGGNANNDNGGGSNANNNQSEAQLTNEMIDSARTPVCKRLGGFLDELQRGEAVDMEEEICEVGTPLGTLCNLFVGGYIVSVDNNSKRIALFDYLVSKDASLDAKTPSGETILAYTSRCKSDGHQALTKHVLQYKDKIDPATIKKAYQDAKAKKNQEIVALFNNVGVNDQNINQL